MYYLAQPISNFLGRDKPDWMSKKVWDISNWEAAYDYAVEMMLKLNKKDIFDVLSPAMESVPFASRFYGHEMMDHSFWMKRDYAFLNAFKEEELVILMSGESYVQGHSQDIAWISPGSKLEYEWAKSHGIPVLNLEAFIGDIKIYL